MNKQMNDKQVKRELLSLWYVGRLSFPISQKNTDHEKSEKSENFLRRKSAGESERGVSVWQNPGWWLPTHPPPLQLPGLQILELRTSTQNHPRFQNHLHSLPHKLDKFWVTHPRRSNCQICKSSNQNLPRIQMNPESPSSSKIATTKIWL